MIVLLFVSALATLLLLPILGVIYTQEHERCEQVDFTISNQCRLTENALAFTVKNSGNNAVDFLISGREDVIETIKPKASDELRFAYGPDATITPTIAILNERYQCKSKRVKLRGDLLVKC